MRFERDPALVVSGHIENDTQVFAGDGGDDGVSPFDGQHSVPGFVEQVQVQHLVETSEPVDVGVDQRDEPTVVSVGDDEAGAGDRVVDAEPFGETGDERGLA